MKYSYSIIIIIFLVIAIIIFNSYSKKKNGFQNYEPWPLDLIRRFKIYQNTVNLNKTQFDLSIIQNQATAEEAENYLKTGYWYWPNDLKYEYINKVWSNPMIKIDPEISLQDAMSIYNQNAARELLAWDSKEGQFLLYGADLGVTDGIPSNLHNTLKCSIDNNGDSVMKKKVYNSMNLWNGYMNTKTTTVYPEDIPKEMAGFSFLNDPCDPCVALNTPNNYSCPFRLNVEGDDKISNQWKYLWEL